MWIGTLHPLKVVHLAASCSAEDLAGFAHTSRIYVGKRLQRLGIVNLLNHPWKLSAVGGDVPRAVCSPLQLQVWDVRKDQRNIFRQNISACHSNRQHEYDQSPSSASLEAWPNPATEKLRKSWGVSSPMDQKWLGMPDKHLPIHKRFSVKRSPLTWEDATSSLIYLDLLGGRAGLQRWHQPGQAAVPTAPAAQPHAEPQPEHTRTRTSDIHQ